MIWSYWDLGETMSPLCATRNLILLNQSSLIILSMSSITSFFSQSYLISLSSSTQSIIIRALQFLRYFFNTSYSSYSFGSLFMNYNIILAIDSDVQLLTNVIPSLNIRLSLRCTATYLNNSDLPVPCSSQITATLVLSS